VSALRFDNRPEATTGLRDARDFTKVQIQIASPDRIRGWSYGEVTKPETINYRTLKPERDGLFDEKIFGPEKDWECACGKYRGQRYAGKTCERCGVEITKSTVRRYRMGHVELATACAHIWYVKDVPSKIGALLNLSTSHLEQVLYFGRYIVTDPQDAKVAGKPLRRGDLLSDDEYRQLRFGQQETYSVQLGESALVGDGEAVEQGQPLAKGVKAKIAGIAQYRFARRVTLDYRELRDARLIVPKVSWIEEEKYAGGQPIAELTADLEIRAEQEGIIELLPIGTDGAILLLRDADDEEIRYAYLVPTGMEAVAGSGEFVEQGDVIARATSGAQLTLPREATASLRASKTKDKQVTMTLEVRWARRETHEINPTMHVLVGDGATVVAGEKIVGAIDAAQEIISAADGTVHLEIGRASCRERV